MAILTAGVVAACGVMAAPAMGEKFGAKLSKVVDPHGSTPTHECLPAAGGCTRAGVNYTATGAVQGNVVAPVDGRIKRIRLIAGTQGNFRLFLLNMRNINLAAGTGEAKAKRRGPRIHYEGTGFTSKPIEHFQLKPGLRVKQGQYLAIRSKRTSMLDCTPVSAHQLVFQPPLGLGGGFVASRAFDRCQLLIQAIIK